MSDETSLTTLTMQVVAAYGSYNHIQPTELDALIKIVRSSLEAVGRPPAAPAASVETLTRAQIRRSITPDSLISFEDGKPYKQLTRHLAARGMTPHDYRAKWGLPADYPMVSANLSAARSAVAIGSGFGKKAPTAGATARASGATPGGRAIEPDQEPEQPAPVALQARENEEPGQVPEQAPAPEPRVRILGRLSLFGRRPATN
ncbi:MAG: MucR family transcriptional regulator [Phenylobacterium sp.]|nr:MucR family transcriptional regulator [Phenylobacterium sp.]